MFDERPYPQGVFFSKKLLLSAFILVKIYDIIVLARQGEKMPAVSFSNGNALYDITPVENIFILEYMANVPGDYVKVYLLGLAMCYHADDSYSVSKLAKDLSLGVDEVKKAFSWWAQMGIVDIVQQRPFEVVYKNIKKEKMQKGNGGKKSLYNNQPLILVLQNIFGGRRVLGSGEMNYVTIWLNEWKVPEEVISLVAAWCVEMKGEKVRFSYINRVLGDIYDQGLVKYDEVERYIKEVSSRTSGAADVLKAWNLNRPPTADEIELYKKWTSEYGMHKLAVREAQKHMTGVSNPNFKYLDSIMERLSKAGVNKAEEAKEYFLKNDSLKEEAREVYAILGGLRISEGRIALYESWLDMGFSHRSVLKAAEALAKTGDRQPDDLDSVLKRWQKNGIVSDKSVAEYMTQIRKTSEKVSELLEQWGENRAPKSYEAAIYNTWLQKKYPDELIELACAKSTNVKEKMAYANKILTVWEQKGIKTTAQAEKETVSFSDKSAPGKKFSDDMYEGLYDVWEDI